MNKTISVAEINETVGDKRQRGISEEFDGQLTSGILRPILERLRRDDTLSLEIRNGYIDIYYRGGRLLNLRANAKADKFTTAFDERYCVEEEWCPKLPPNPGKTIASPEQAQAWVDVFASHKQIMDIHFCRRPKIEREYQQAVVRDNNRHGTGERSDYVIVDVEYAQSPARLPRRKIDYRFDMVGFRWPLAEGSRGRDVVTPVIMEMKAGDGALASSCRPGKTRRRHRGASSNRPRARPSRAPTSSVPRAPALLRPQAAPRPALDPQAHEELEITAVTVAAPGDLRHRQPPAGLECAPPRASWPGGRHARRLPTWPRCSTPATRSSRRT